MIRAVPIDYFVDGSHSHLAFLSTVDNRFREFNGIHVWDSWQDLSEDAIDDDGVVDTAFLVRVKPLCPKWFFKKKNEPPNTTKFTSEHWEQIFTKYVGEVLRCEGVDFLYDHAWSDEEWQVFKRLLSHLTTTFDD